MGTNTHSLALYAQCIVAYNLLIAHMHRVFRTCHSLLSAPNVLATGFARRAFLSKSKANSKLTWKKLLRIKVWLTQGISRPSMLLT